MPRLLTLFVLPFAFSLVVFSTSASQIPTDGLVAHYPFNGDANDKSGNGNDGVVLGASLTDDRFGNPGQAYLFDGVDDLISIPNSPSLQSIDNAVTIATWVYVNGWYSTWAGVASKSNTIARAQYGIAFQPGGRVDVDLVGTKITLLTSFQFEINTWYFLCMTWDGNEVQVYANENLIGGSFYAPPPLSNDMPLEIGRHTPVETEYMNGLIDDVRIYDRALNESEILDLYNEPPADPLAQNGICYGSTGNVEPNNPGALISIDPLTGAGTLIGPTGIIGDGGPAVRALAIKSTGEMYAMSHTASSDLYSVNASTGAGTLVANTGLLRPGDICFDAEDVLYAVDETNILYTIDETNGVRTVVGATGVALAGLAYDPTDGTMYGSGIADDIYTIDLETGAATFVGTTGLGGNTPDIHFDQAGNLFGAKRGAGGVYDYISIDKTTGTGTLIGSTGFVAVVGLATRLEPPSAIPCTDVANFQTRCQGGGTIQARLTLANTNYTGEIVEFSIDGSPYQVTVGASGRANLSVGVFDLGLHEVEVTNPAGCVDPRTVRCRSGVAMEGDELWDDETELETPTTTTLLGNYPNPFNPSTTLRYALAEPGLVSLKVYNMLGQLVRTIVDEHQVEGYHEVIWDGSNETGATVSSGIYVCRMTVGSFVETKRMLLVK